MVVGVVLCLGAIPARGAEPKSRGLQRSESLRCVSEAVSADSPAAAVGVVRQHLVPGSETFPELSLTKVSSPQDRKMGWQTEPGCVKLGKVEGHHLLLWNAGEVTGKEGKAMVKTSPFFHGCCCSGRALPGQAVYASPPAIPAIPE